MWSPISPAFSNNRTRKSSFPASFASCFNRIAAARPAGPSYHIMRTYPLQQWHAARRRGLTTTDDTHIYFVALALNMSWVESVPLFARFPAQCRGERSGLAHSVAGNEFASGCSPPPGWCGMRRVAAVSHTGEAILPGPPRGWKHLPSQERQQCRFRSHRVCHCASERLNPRRLLTHPILVEFRKAKMTAESSERMADESRSSGWQPITPKLMAITRRHPVLTCTSPRSPRALFSPLPLHVIQHAPNPADIILEGLLSFSLHDKSPRPAFLFVFESRGMAELPVLLLSEVDTKRRACDRTSATPYRTEHGRRRSSLFKGQRSLSYRL